MINKIRRKIKELFIKLNLIKENNKVKIETIDEGIIVYDKNFNVIFVSKESNKKIQECKIVNIIQKAESEILFISVKDINSKNNYTKKLKLKGDINPKNIDRIINKLYTEWLGDNRQPYEYILENRDENLLSNKKFY